ncbi:MAG: asparagine synthase-related protein [Candidatus Thermoplasmatota archaeon]|jgi:asparagine synthase (glutamine-hydrolysing)|nr:asparagine synthase-related protein [Candidatus Thermoplasmatota archaeon]MCL5987708.1 asparagine synthase-related protein [Candidatus Thermoplasmatota archaeon]
MDATIRAKELLDRLSDSEHLIHDGTAIMLSGGVDSSLLLACYSSKLIPYSIGFPGSQDILMATRLCNDLGMKLKIIEATEETVKDAANHVLELDDGINFTELGFETTLFFALSSINEDFVMTGQGADEIFYGYSKFVDGREDSNSSSLKILMERTLPRENKISSALGKKLVLPYLMGEIPETFKSLSREDHIRNGVGKIIVREACRLKGLPSYIYQRPKKAAQYGTGFSRHLELDFRRRVSR